jgi:hypothetical protein
MNAKAGATRSHVYGHVSPDPLDIPSRLNGVNSRKNDSWPSSKTSVDIFDEL